MSYEARTNGAHVLKCDTGVCSNELLAPDQQSLYEDANLCGWHEDNGKHACPDCTRGANMHKAITKAMFGNAAPTITAPADVRAGDPVFNEDGKQVATYARDAKMGESVEVELYVPVKANVSVSDRYAEILGRTPSTPKVPSNPPGYPDPLFDAFDEEPAPQVAQEQPTVVTIDDLFDEPASPPSVPTTASGFPAEVFGRHAGKKAPAGAQAAHPGIGKRTLDAPAGTTGGAGLVQAPPRPDPAEVQRAAASAPKRKHGLKIEALNEASDVFNFLDQSEKTRWNPDGK